ncbi:hypothetical protein CC86DRAFT_334740 [Ophiobolus disseminans]|uniref:NYN domain-containing protein n=1 Tax=Ophiobolus disseminans TaxID=1469910 RepID=A0A6A6ZFU0_9PLEO|nr:hypothetical protein CC86DRAFT_334740 [Ophiobolus disseminans]
MPSQPLDSGWNFSPVFDLIESDPHDVGSPTLRPETRPTKLSGGGVGLGNFWKLYESLGMSNEVVIPPVPLLDESELSNSDDAQLPPPTLGARQPPSTAVQERFIQVDEIVTPDLPIGTTKKQRRKARRQAEQALQEEAIKHQPTSESQSVLKAVADASPTKTSRAQSNVGAKIRPTSPVPQVPQTPNKPPRPILSKRSRSPVAPVTPQPPAPPSQLQTSPLKNGPTQFTILSKPAPFQYALAPQFLSQLQPAQAVPASSGLVPRNVRPVTVPRNSFYAGSQPHPVLVPVRPNSALVPATPSLVPFSRYPPSIAIRSQVDRHFHLFEKLLVRFLDERKWLIHPRQLINENTIAEGIHVFVDASNIMIGFRDMLRNNRVAQPYDLSFDSLALLMERRRPVAKRVLVGSHREANPLPATQRLMETCKAVGYECNIQEQVFIAREESQKRKFFNDVNKLGWQKAIQKRSGSGSDSETGAATPKMPVPQRWLEQGVDELLHLKMCQSMLDTELPSTMVLATGDGAEAEMSDGFLAHVERALRKGWKVELITWKQQTNGGYKRRAFRQKWGEQFTIIELDDFLEDLIDTP